MQYDFINELGYLALATRLRRISEAMVHSNRQLYRELGMDIAPNWLLIFKLLEKYGELSITEMAGKLHFSHPSVISMVKRMEVKGYLKAVPDNGDLRRKMLKLTEKATKKMAEFERVWTAASTSVSRLLSSENKFLQELESIEIRLSQAEMRIRILDELRNTPH